MKIECKRVWICKQNKFDGVKKIKQFIKKYTFIFFVNILIDEKKKGQGPEIPSGWIGWTFYFKKIFANEADKIRRKCTS